ncbi:MAG: hypothetical protein KJS91_15170 [Planctomycetes bacterium]|nr:hypothetical protein [Planctomycetota bacterium]
MNQALDPFQFLSRLDLLDDRCRFNRLARGVSAQFSKGLSLLGSFGEPSCLQPKVDSSQFARDSIRDWSRFAVESFGIGVEKSAQCEVIEFPREIHATPAMPIDGINTRPCRGDGTQVLFQTHFSGWAVENETALPFVIPWFNLKNLPNARHGAVVGNENDF